MSRLSHLSNMCTPKKKKTTFYRGQSNNKKTKQKKKRAPLNALQIVKLVNVDSMPYRFICLAIIHFNSV